MPMYVLSKKGGLGWLDRRQAMVSITIFSHEVHEVTIYV